MSATDAFENALLLHYFQNVDHANVGDAAGLQNSAAAGSFYISLHTSDPGETGAQNTSECAYGGYARQAVARSSAGWTVSGSNVSNAATITFPTAASGSETATHFGIGSAVSGVGNLFWKGALTTPRALSTGVTPSFAIGELDVDVT